jgi:hypothetical protein
MVHEDAREREKGEPMKDRRVTVAVFILVAAVAVVTVLLNSKERIAKRVYMRSSRNLVSKLSPTLQQKYGTELRYTLDKFWEFYEQGLLSREDLNDVMDRMKMLRAKKSITDREIFDFIGYVSRLYTEAMNRRQREPFPE